MSLPYDAIQVENDLQFRPQTTDDLRGIAVIDFAKRGYLTDMLDTYSKDFNSLELVLKVNKVGAACDVIIYTDEVLRTALTEA
jgi:hypothetical protein